MHLLRRSVEARPYHADPHRVIHSQLTDYVKINLRSTRPAADPSTRIQSVRHNSLRDDNSASRPSSSLGIMKRRQRRQALPPTSSSERAGTAPTGTAALQHYVGSCLVFRIVPAPAALRTFLASLEHCFIGRFSYRLRPRSFQSSSRRSRTKEPRRRINLQGPTS